VNRIQAQAPCVAALLAERNFQSDPASQLYMATMQARLPADTPIEVPDNETFGQLQHIDQLSHEMQTRQQGGQESGDANFRFVRVQIQGAALQIHVGNLRTIWKTSTTTTDHMRMFAQLSPNKMTFIENRVS
jgi:hypothetical protein